MLQGMSNARVQNPDVVSYTEKRITDSKPTRATADLSTARSDGANCWREAKSRKPHSVTPTTRPQVPRLFSGSGDHETATRDQATRAKIKITGIRGIEVKMPVRFRSSNSRARDVITKRTTRAFDEKMAIMGNKMIATANIRVVAPEKSGRDSESLFVCR